MSDQTWTTDLPVYGLDQAGRQRLADELNRKGIVVTWFPEGVRVDSAWAGTVASLVRDAGGSTTPVDTAVPTTAPTSTGSFGAPLPPGQAPAWAYQPGVTPYPATISRPNSSKATLALVLGIVSIAACQLTGPVAIVLGVQARREIRESNGALDGDGLATAGLITGIVGSVLLVFVALYFVFFFFVFAASF